MHCSIDGNERADTLAKAGSNLPQPSLPVTLDEEKTIIKTTISSRWKKSHGDYNTQDPYFQLDRKSQVILFRLRTGHNRLRQHLHNYFRVGDTEMCQCDSGPQNTEHILQYCPTLDDLRRRVWPDGASLKDKLYGSLDSVKRTIHFMEATGLQI